MNKSEFDEKQYYEDIKKYEKSLASSASTANRVIHILMMLVFHSIGEDILNKGF